MARDLVVGSGEEERRRKRGAGGVGRGGEGRQDCRKCYFKRPRSTEVLGEAAKSQESWLGLEGTASMAQCSPTSSKLHPKVSSQGGLNGDSVSPNVCSQVMFL